MKRLRKARKPKKQRYPITLERQFESQIRRMVAFIQKDVNLYLKPRLPSLLLDSEQRNDDYSSDITGILGQLDSLGQQRFRTEGFNDIANRIGADVSTFNRSEFQKVIKSVIGVNIFKNEPWLNAELDTFSEEATSYITKLNDDTIREVGRLTRDGVKNGVRAETIAKDLSKQFGISRNRASLIARDQIGKLNGQLTKRRQQSVGIEEYKWRNSQDSRVVGNPNGLYPTGNAKHGNHWNREGKTYNWNDAPSDGNPGQPIRCRCFAEPVLPDDLLEQHGFE